jgi:hypothetical protein
MSCNIKTASKINKKTKKNTKTKSKSNARKQRGGSLASELVNQAANSPPVMNDFITSPRVRDGPMADDFVTQYGGSEASDMVMSNLKNSAKTNKFPEGFNVKGDISSLNTYQPSGGSRKSRGHKSRNGRKARGRKSRGRKSRSSRKSYSSCNSTKMKGGGSDWISSQYSLGSYNGPEMSAGDVAKFGSSLAGSRANYMNPPNLGSAGSGTPMGSLEGANVRMTGSPLI